MKSKITLIYIFLVTIFTGCNSGIFIEDFITDIPDTCKVEKDKAYKLHFDTEEWDILNVYSTKSMLLDIYELDGKTKKDYLPLENGENAIISYEDTYCRFRIEKRNSQEMEIICDKNLNNSPMNLSIEVGNKYVRKTIKVSLKPTEKFVIDRVEYDFENDFYHNTDIVEQVDGITVNNTESSEGSITLNFYPYKNSKRRIKFYPDNYEIFNNLDKILGENLAEIQIPDIVEGKPVVQKTKVTFGLLEQSFWTGKLDRNLVVQETVNPGETKNIEIYNKIEEFHVNYKVHISNPATGEKYIFTGRLNSMDPFGYRIIYPIDDKNV